MEAAIVVPPYCHRFKAVASLKVTVLKRYVPLRASIGTRFVAVITVITVFTGAKERGICFSVGKSRDKMAAFGDKSVLKGQ